MSLRYRHRPFNLPAVAAIIPAYNESENLGGVLDVLRQVSGLSQIIVVDDGSQDDTAEVVGQAAVNDLRIRLIQHSCNQGKGQAIFTGASATQAPVLLLLDADLINLKPQHIESLIEPVISDAADMTLGLFRAGHLNTDFAHWITPCLTGQRCLNADLIQHIVPEAAAGYGFETALTIAARKQHTCTQIVFLKGVWHPPSEFHIGLWKGLGRRLRMYRHIFRAWRMAGGSRSRRRTKRRSLGLGLLSLIFLSLLVFGGSSNLPWRDSLSPAVAQMTPLPLAGAQRVLVVAPHPDDETIGAGGLIQAALAQGAQVRVVVVTNGDGQRLSPLVIQKSLEMGSEEYIRMGEQRQQESLSAMQSLGLSAQNVIFLSYPDRGMLLLWSGNWTKDCPLRSAYTGAARSPYPLTFDPSATYCGQSVLDDFSSILANFRPDLIVIPHPADKHPDHRASSNFALLAAAELNARQPDYQPEVWGYLVHYADFPETSDEKIAPPIQPPAALSGPESCWAYLTLTPDQARYKSAALHSYTSQQRLLGKLLNSFAGQDEIFVELPIAAPARTNS